LNDIRYYESLLGVGRSDTYEDINKAVDSILQGNIALFVEGINKCITASLKNPPGRPVEKADTELS
jgi:hypothetical protein